MVEDGDLEVAGRNMVKREGAIGGALGERKIRAVRCTQADVTVREAVRVVAPAAVDALIGRAAHACVRDYPAEGGVARLVGAHQLLAVAGGPLAAIDEGRVRKADGDVVTAWPELLEVTRLVRLDERLDRLGAVECVRLQPFLASCHAIRRG